MSVPIQIVGIKFWLKLVHHYAYFAQRYNNFCVLFIQQIKKLDYSVIVFSQTQILILWASFNISHIEGK